MIRFNLQDGTTSGFDLQDPEGQLSFQAARANPTFQAAIRGAQVDWGGTAFALPVPTGFYSRPLYDAELVEKDGHPIAIRLMYYVDKFQIVLTVFTGRRHFCRTDVKKVGRMRHSGFIPPG